MIYNEIIIKKEVYDATRNLEIDEFVDFFSKFFDHYFSNDRDKHKMNDKVDGLLDLAVAYTDLVNDLYEG